MILPLVTFLSFFQFLLKTQTSQLWSVGSEQGWGQDSLVSNVPPLLQMDGLALMQTLLFILHLVMSRQLNHQH